MYTIALQIYHLLFLLVMFNNVDYSEKINLEVERDGAHIFC